MHQFRRLEVWQAAVDLAVSIYELTATYPTSERFGLTSQMRRAAVSVSSNIAEGAGRGSPKEMAQFLRLAIGSICELESQIELSERLGFVQETDQVLADAGVLRARVKTLADRVSIPNT